VHLFFNVYFKDRVASGKKATFFYRLVARRREFVSMGGFSFAHLSIST